MLGGRYVANRRLRVEGGYERWAASDTVLERPVELVCLPTSSPQGAAFLDAARRAAALEDSRIVRILDVGSTPALRYVVEESLSGAKTLAELLTDGPLPAEEARRVTGEVAVALERARGLGIHHLVLTPTSVIRTGDGEVKVRGLAVDAALHHVEEPDPDLAARRDVESAVALAYAALTTRWPLRTPFGLPAPGIDPAPRIVGGVAAASEIAAGVPADLDLLIRLTLRDGQGPATPGALANQIAPWPNRQVDVTASSAQVRPTPAMSVTEPPRPARKSAAATSAGRAVAGSAAVGSAAVGSAAVTSAASAATAAAAGPAGSADRAAKAPVTATTDPSATVRFSALGGGAATDAETPTSSAATPAATPATPATPAATPAAATSPTVAIPRPAARSAVPGGAAPSPVIPPAAPAASASASPAAPATSPAPSVGPTEFPFLDDAAAAPRVPHGDDSPGSTSESAFGTAMTSASAAASALRDRFGTYARAAADKAAQAAEHHRDLATAGAAEDAELSAALNDFSDDELESPAPLLPAVPDSPTKSQSKVAIGVLVALVLIALVVALGNLPPILGGSSSHIPSSSQNTAGPSATASTGPDASPSSSPSEIASGGGSSGPLQIVAASSYDPQGDGKEGDSTVKYAWDGNPSTYWTSEWYVSAAFSGLKKGVGLVFDLGATHTVTSVQVTFPAAQSATVFVGPNPGMDGATSIGSQSGNGQVTFTATTPATGRYVTVWVTKAAPIKTPGKYSAEVSEVTIDGS